MKRRDFLKAPVLGMALPAVAAFDRMPPPWDGDEVSPPPGEMAKFQQRLHQDFATYAPGMEYFMLGNGDVQAALQYCPDRSGELPQSFLGLTIFDPEHFARKWSTFLFHPERGLERSLLTLSAGGKSYAVAPENFSAVRWIYPRSIPTVELTWKANTCAVTERFFTPHEGPFLFREVDVKNGGDTPLPLKLALTLYPSFALFDEIAPEEKTRTVQAHGFATMTLQSLDGEVSVGGRYDMGVSLGSLSPGETKTVRFVYSIAREVRLLDRAAYDRLLGATETYWTSLGSVTTGEATLDHLFAVSRSCLRAMIARSGKRDSGIWMYNMEWVRDDIMVALGLLQLGMEGLARILLTKIVEKSIGADGRTIESSRWSGFDYTELDQNGQVLYGVWAYACWTGDMEFVKKHWGKLALAAEFPLQAIFRDTTSGLMHNKREFWERNDGQGVEDGYELAYQFWVALGLQHAADLAHAIGAPEEKHWRQTAEAIRTAILSHPRYSLVEEGHFIKRRTRDGRWQRFMIPPDPSRMPPGSPLATEAKPECEPDSANVLPVIFGMVDPTSDLARGTLQHVEGLWNQRWNFGGYSRYNVSSEPDPPAPWPIATLYMARAYVEAGNDGKFWQCVNWVRTIHGGLSGGWFERYGPSITPPAPPVSVVGWAWAEVVSLLIHHIVGFRPGLTALELRPRLPKGVNALTCSLRLRGATVDVEIHRTAEEASATLSGKSIRLEKGALSIPYSAWSGNARIRMAVP